MNHCGAGEKDREATLYRIVAPAVWLPELVERGARAFRRSPAVRAELFTAMDGMQRVTGKRRGSIGVERCPT